MFRRVIFTCERWYYKTRDASTPKLNLATKIFHVDSYVVLFSSFFLLCGDLKFDLMFFIQLIWWIRTCQILKQFDQAKMFQILLYTLSNLFDSTNLIKLIWPWISGDLSIVDWFKNCVTFVFLKTILIKMFLWKLVFQSIFLPFFASSPVIFFKKTTFFSVITQFAWLPLVFTRFYILSTSFF